MEKYKENTTLVQTLDEQLTSFEKMVDKELTTKVSKKNIKKKMKRLKEIDKELSENIEDMTLDEVLDIYKEATKIQRDCKGYLESDELVVE